VAANEVEADAAHRLSRAAEEARAAGRARVALEEEAAELRASHELSAAAAEAEAEALRQVCVCGGYYRAILFGLTRGGGGGCRAACEQ